MAKDNEASKAADKGKAKAADAKAQDASKDKDGKPVANGKKDDKKDEKPDSEC
jgi:26S proteasome regulatory subunit N1